MYVFRSTLKHLFLNTDYDKLISMKNKLEKRKFISLILAVYSSATLNEIANIKIYQLFELMGGDYVNVSGRNITLDADSIQFITEDLYKDLIDERETYDFLIVSMAGKPISPTNLKRDCHEEIVGLMTDDLIVKEITIEV